MNIKKFYSFLIIILISVMSLFLSLKAKASTINNICADSYVLVESKTLRVLDEKNMNKRLLPASITKILTCIVAIENGELDNYYTVTKEVVEQTGSSIYFEVGEKVKLIDLLYAMMLRSGNDAAYMTAISVSNSFSDFIYLMNKTAKKIGMENSLFSNPSGLDETTENYSTAFDMAKLMSYALKNEIFSKITGTIKYSFETINGKKRTIENKHKLVKGYDFITGGKTGVVPIFCVI